jgi:hypothetical protein
MNIIEGFILTIMIVLIIFYIQNQNIEVEYIISSVNGKSYLVKNLPDKKEAANLLAKLNNTLQNLISKMQETYPDSEDVKRLVSNYDPDSLSEGTETSNYTSYSVNKGEKIVFCLRSRDGNDKLVPINVLKYVAIHELSHLMTKEIGHPQQFWENFKLLVQVAVKNKLYRNTNYSNKPVKYCGITIKSSVI